MGKGSGLEGVLAPVYNETALHSTHFFRFSRHEPRPAGTDERTIDDGRKATGTVVPRLSSAVYFKNRNQP